MGNGRGQEGWWGGARDAGRQADGERGASGRAAAELGQGQEWLRQLVEEQWWCGACRELRSRWELEGFEREGQLLFVCLACGELVEALPF